MAGPSRYSAFEPDLMLWVLATLIEASVQGYELVWGPLHQPKREAFYREFRRFGSYFGLSEADCPAGYREFTEYYQAMLHGDLLGSHPLCAEVAAAVVRPPAPRRDRILGRIFDFLPIETVPAHLRERLGLESTASTRLRMASLRRLAPIAFRVLPGRRPTTRNPTRPSGPWACCEGINMRPCGLRFTDICATTSDHCIPGGSWA